MSYNLQKDRWYIDLQGNIQLHTAYDIVEMLLKHEAKVSHRVSRDRTNWAAICNQEYFEQAIHDLAGQLAQEAAAYGKLTVNSTNQGEVSGFHNLKNMKVGINEQLKQAQVLQDINFRLQGLRQLTQEITAKKKIVVDMSAQIITEEIHPDDRNVYVNQPSFWDQFYKRFTFLNFKSAKVRTAYLTLLIFGGACVVGVSKYLEYRDRMGVQAEAIKMQEALLANTTGDYNRAVQIYAGVKNKSALSQKELVEMATAQAQLKQYDSALMTMQTPITSPVERVEMAKGLSQLGLIALKNGDRDQARLFFSKASESADTYVALLNGAILSLEKNEFAEAEKSLLRASALPGHDKGPLLLALTEVGLALDRQVPQAPQAQGTAALNSGEHFGRLHKINEMIELEKNPLQVYYQHLLVAQAVIAATVADPQQFEKVTLEWLHYDPRMGDVDSKKQEESLMYQRTTWAHLYNWGLAVYNSTFDHKLKSAFFAALVARAKGIKEAIPFALHSYNNSIVAPPLRGFLGLLVLSSGNVDGARQILRGGDLSTARLGLAALGELCANYPDAACKARKMTGSSEGRVPSSK